MTLLQHSKDAPSKKNDAIVITIFFLYCSAFAISRLLISSTMELDEAEQFLLASVFQWGYPSQPPLYSWIIHMLSSISGLNIFTLIFTKYSILFLFYAFFYLTTRACWETDKSLTATASLMLIPLYAYEFNRDLSHSILVALIAVLTCMVYIRMLTKRSVLSYIVIGLCVAFGILSKYNFTFFLFALMAASLSTNAGRRLLFDKRSLISVFVCLVVLLPHFIWLFQENFAPFSHGMRKAQAGALYMSSPMSILATILSPYLGLMLFLLVFASFFAPFFAFELRNKSPRAEILSLATLYGMIIPICAVIVFGASHFAERWLAPIMFIIPLACFHLVDLDMQSRRSKVFRGLGVLIALLVLLVRIFIGFMPDVTGKVEHIHMPFHELSVQLSGSLSTSERPDRPDLTIVTDDAHIAANIMAWIPGMRFVHLWKVRENALKRNPIPSNNVIILWDAEKLGRETPEKFLRYYPLVRTMFIQAPYLHAKKHSPFVLAIGFVVSQNEGYGKSPAH
jgi:lipopolysaccharide core galacturonosyltransferase RgtB